MTPDLYDPDVDAASLCPVHKVWVTLGTGDCLYCEADFHADLGEMRW